VEPPGAGLQGKPSSTNHQNEALPPHSDHLQDPRPPGFPRRMRGHRQPPQAGLFAADGTGLALLVSCHVDKRGPGFPGPERKRRPR
jgi:hypothetical protein